MHILTRRFQNVSLAGGLTGTGRYGVSGLGCGELRFYYVFTRFLLGFLLSFLLGAFTRFRRDPDGWPRAEHKTPGNVRFSEPRKISESEHSWPRPAGRFTTFFYYVLY